MPVMWSSTQLAFKPEANITFLAHVQICPDAQSFLYNLAFYLPLICLGFLCLCRDRNSLPLFLLMSSSFSSDIRAMLPSSKKLGNVLSLFCSICARLLLFNVCKNSAVKPSGLKIFFVGRFLD